jgi:DNA-binding transcriptional regulator YiaG
MDAANPTPETIRAARMAAGLSQTAAARLVSATLRSWQQWEAGDNRMHPGLFELFQLKTKKTEKIA